MIKITGVNSKIPASRASCFVGQEMNKFEMQIFVGSSSVKSRPAGSRGTLCAILSAT